MWILQNLTDEKSILVQVVAWCVRQQAITSEPMLSHKATMSWSRPQMKLEQLERLRSKDTPAASWLPILLIHIGSQVKRRQSQSYKFKEFAKIPNFLYKIYTWHTFWSCLIRCANMKKIRRVLLKTQSEQDSVHRRTDGQAETSILPFNFVEAEGIINKMLGFRHIFSIKCH